MLCFLPLSWQVADGQAWIIVDAGGGTIDIAMHKVEAVPNRPGQLQLSEVTRSMCMLKGSSMLDEQMEEAILKPLFTKQGAGSRYVQWKKDNPRDYIELVGVKATNVLCSTGRGCRVTHICGSRGTAGPYAWLVHTTQAVNREPCSSVCIVCESGFNC